jgi:hypothetical protein
VPNLNDQLAFALALFPIIGENALAKSQVTIRLAGVCFPVIRENEYLTIPQSPGKNVLPVLVDAFPQRTYPYQRRRKTQPIIIKSHSGHQSHQQGAGLERAS